MRARRGKKRNKKQGIKNKRRAEIGGKINKFLWSDIIYYKIVRSAEFFDGPPKNGHSSFSFLRLCFRFCPRRGSAQIRSLHFFPFVLSPPLLSRIYIHFAGIHTQGAPKGRPPFFWRVKVKTKKENRRESSNTFVWDIIHQKINLVTCGNGFVVIDVLF